MTDKEHKDIYIACAVGGVGLILVLMYLFGGSTPSAALNADGTPLPTSTAQVQPGLTDYNYNIAPYNPAPVIPNAKSVLPSNIIPLGGGCCDTCGPDTGSQYNQPNVAQFMTLIGTGAG